MTLEDCQRHRERDDQIGAFLRPLDMAPTGSGLLDGLAVAVKDNLCLEGQLTTAGSQILKNFRPPYTATVLQRVLAAGGTLVGKTNLDEFSMGSSTENSSYQKTRNPWDLQRVPGGSSGGSAAAVAAQMCHLALGSDTGGSIRQPAAFCGITGLKPTYGRVSRYGLIAYASSLDQIGPLAYSAEDCARLLQVIAGPDPLDSTCFQETPPDYLQTTKTALGSGLKLGWDPALLQGLDAAMADNFRAALKIYQDLGVSLVEVSLPRLRYALPAYYLIATAEASSNLARYDGVRYGERVAGKEVAAMMSATRAAGFGAEVKRRIMLGTYALSSGYYDAYYHKAQKVRTLLRQDMLSVLAGVDAFALPTTPAPAFKVGEKSDDPLAMYLSDIYTVVANLTGLPALSHPSGFVEGLPVGFQLMGGSWQEGLLLQLAHAFQGVTAYHQQRPQVAPLV